MIETALVFDDQGKVIRFHLPNGRTGGSIPDSRSLWELLWQYRETVGGVAHTHPWDGTPTPSDTDVTTWRAIELGLGKLLLWPIVTFTEVRCFVWTPIRGSAALRSCDVYNRMTEQYVEAGPLTFEISGLDRLVELSRG